MGLLDKTCGGRVYLDTNIFIYAQERLEPYAAAISKLFQAIAAGGQEGATSELTLAECLVKPIANQDVELAALYRETLVTSDTLWVLPVTRDVLIRAAQLRATHRLRLPDAIHASTAIEGGCATLLTNDGRFRVDGAPRHHSLGHQFHGPLTDPGSRP